MPLPEIVVFDLGKVLVDFDYGIAARKLAALGSAPLGQIAALFGATPLLLSYESGRLSTRKFFEEIGGACGFRGSLEEFSNCFGDIFSPIDPMIQLQEVLRGKGVPTYIFSNTNDLAIRHIQRTFPFFAQFDGYILSFEHGVMKPDPALYEVVERQTGRRGQAILYIDDRPENVETGAARGWQTILQETPAKTIDAVRRLGLLGPALVN